MALAALEHDQPLNPIPDYYELPECGDIVIHLNKASDHIQYRINVVKHLLEAGQSVRLEWH